mmetsp:Transcript_46968/g.132490  ORF Transcript_46968/g.132490 Transcript_46968/m.132490 type:complete len:236 (+) Transcript_46968:103-810(+)
MGRRLLLEERGAAADVHGTIAARLPCGLRRRRPSVAGRGAPGERHRPGSWRQGVRAAGSRAMGAGLHGVPPGAATRPGHAPRAPGGDRQALRQAPPLVRPRAEHAGRQDQEGERPAAHALAGAGAPRRPGADVGGEGAPQGRDREHQAGPPGQSLRPQCNRGRRAGEPAGLGPGLPAALARRRGGGVRAIRPLRPLRDAGLREARQAAAGQPGGRGEREPPQAHARLPRERGRAG